MQVWDIHRIPLSVLGEFWARWTGSQSDRMWSGRWACAERGCRSCNPNWETRGVPWAPSFIHETHRMDGEGGRCIFKHCLGQCQQRNAFFMVFWNPRFSSVWSPEGLFSQLMLPPRLTASDAVFFQPIQNPRPSDSNSQTCRFPLWWILPRSIGTNLETAAFL